MAIAGLLLGLMVLAFTAQSRTYNTQQDISTLQEDMKSALQLMSRDIRMAGYDPHGTAGASIVSATATTFHATQDLNGNGSLVNPNLPANPDEDVLYSFVTPPAGSTTSLFRSSNGGTPQPVIDNILNLAFAYLTTSGTWILPPVDSTTVRAVSICMQGRTARQTSPVKDTSAFNPTPYINNPPDNPPVFYNWTPANPGNYGYRTMCIQVVCRNLQPQ